MALACALVYLAQAWLAPRMGDVRARTVLLSAWVLHALLALWSVADHGPRFGFAPALSVTAWLVVGVYLADRRLVPQANARRALALLGAGTVIMAALFPGTALHPSASPWMPMHLALGIASYGLFGAAVTHAWVMMNAERNMRRGVQGDSALPLLTLERLTYRFASAGFVLLSATLLAGLLFGEQLYGAGKVWRWDHKSVFSVLSWAVFAVLLVGRARFGWRGRQAVRFLYFGAILLLLAYVGSRFVIEVVLGRPL